MPSVANSRRRHQEPSASRTGANDCTFVDAEFNSAGTRRSDGRAAARAAYAEMTYNRRRARDHAFGDDAVIFGEPTWDILLDLYHREYGGEAVAVSAACVAGCRSVSAAMRHIERLEERDLLVRSPDLTDARRSWVSLTPRGRSVMDGLIDRLIGLGG